MTDDLVIPGDAQPAGRDVDCDQWNHSPERDTHALTCPACESMTLTHRHCKRLCVNCGYAESCEDLF